MKEKKKWDNMTRFTDRVRIDPKWKELLEKEQGKTVAQKLDNLLSRVYAGKKKTALGRRKDVG